MNEVMTCRDRQLHSRQRSGKPRDQKIRYRRWQQLKQVDTDKLAVIRY